MSNPFGQQNNQPSSNDLMGLLDELETAINTTNEANQNLRKEVLNNISKIMNSINSLKDKITSVVSNINSSKLSMEENENLKKIINDAKSRISAMTTQLQEKKKIPNAELQKIHSDIIDIDKNLSDVINSIPSPNPQQNGGKKQKRKTAKKRKSGKKSKSYKKQRGGYVYKSSSSSSRKKPSSTISWNSAPKKQSSRSSSSAPSSY